MPLILPGNVGSATAATGFNVANSLRFNDGSADRLQRTQDTADSRKKFTLSYWIKKTNTARIMVLHSFNSGNYIYHDYENDRLSMYSQTGGTLNFNVTPTRVFKDVSAWYHIVIAVDTTQGTAANRMKIYVNGVQETVFTNSSYPSQNLDCEIGTTDHLLNFGAYNVNSDPVDGYLAEVVLIDNQALAADQFGEFDSDSGIWKPINVSGLTFGTNGSYLEFKETGTSANASGMGADTSGNANHFAVANLTAVDQSIDTCTNNFATFNPLVNNFGDNMTLSEGNLVATGPDSSHNSAFSTFGVTKGKWYWEAKFVDASDNFYHGVAGSNITSGNIENPMNANGFTGWNNGNGGEILKDGDNTSNDYGTLGDNDILGVALNADDYQITFYKNGSALVSNYALSTTGRDTLHVLHVGSSTSAVSSYNFGSPAHAISSGNTDGDGFGNFEYAVPSGFFALCTKNLAEYG